MDSVDAMFAQGNKSSVVYAVVIVVILVLIGVLAFGLGGAVVANKGLGVGACGGIRFGMPTSREGLIRVQNATSKTEGYRTPQVGGYGGPRPINPRTGSTGVWDSGQGTMAIGGDFMTIMGHDEKYDLGINGMRPLASL